MFLLVNTTYIH